MSGRWLLHDHAILRSTGFPWQLVEALDWPRTDAALADLDRAESDLADAVTGVVTAVRADPSAVEPRLSRKLRKALNHHDDAPDELFTAVESQPVRSALREYAKRLAAVRDARHTAEWCADEETGESHRALVDAVTDPAVREAVWLSSPSMHDRGIGELSALAARPSRGPARRLRRQFAAYLQRLSAKNETTSFFGPVNYAEFGQEPTGAEPLVSAPALRSASLAYWAVVVLADAVAADPAVRPHLRPRTSGLVSRAEPLTVAGKRASLPPATLALLRAADGRHTVTELARSLGASPDTVLATARHAADRGLLLLDCRPPVAVTDALGWLRAEVASFPSGADWLRLLDRIQGLLAAFGTADLERRRELLAELEREIARQGGGAVRRGGGEWYADRLVVHEEALGSVSPLALGRALRDRLRERLAPALDLLAAEAVAHHARLTRQFLERHPELASGATVPLLTLLRTPATDATDAMEPAAPYDGPLTSAGLHLAELVERAARTDPGRPLRVDPADLPPVDLGTDPLIASPDVMFRAESLADVLAGDGDLVLAECHDTLLIWGWALQFHPRRQQVQEAGAELLRRACADTTMAVVLGSRRAKIVPFDFPGPVVDLGSTPPHGDRPRLPLADVGVVLRGDRLVCTAPGVPHFLLHHGELDSDVHNVLAPPRVRPVRFGRSPRTPRVVLGDVVLARARWEVDRAELFPRQGGAVDELRLLRTARAAAVAHGLPRRGFLKVPGERKPVLLDLRAPALLDLGRHLSARAARDHVVLTELLPGPDGLWLRGERGRHCAELRTTMVLDRTNGPARPGSPGPSGHLGESGRGDAE
ncbi:lantibiotic dehydratase [Streptomyces sp. AC536]|uniref:lantibiotic dehydratase n=1 Tax=Streptomyces buecherae TaxID=2763006 RepID=UPI00164DA3A1|nr:lantibiotic dehydratase [Streptomyces buecherae]MBC3987224.1 lantibiotic dehydratase [Streptomyces buecherae]QNJ43565.1 lantibiotic dehydratase [Streptomyces buecherae]